MNDLFIVKKNQHVIIESLTITNYVKAQGTSFTDLHHQSINQTFSIIAVLLSLLSSSITHAVHALNANYHHHHTIHH